MSVVDKSQRNIQSEYKWDLIKFCGGCFIAGAWWNREEDRERGRAAVSERTRDTRTLWLCVWWQQHQQIKKNEEHNNKRASANE